MKPEELQRILDTNKQSSNNAALYIVALIIAGVFMLVLYEGW